MGETLCHCSNCTAACGEGDSVDPFNPVACVATVPCGGHGHLDGTVCHCDRGYTRAFDAVTGDSGKCIPADGIATNSWVSSLEEPPTVHLWELLGSEETDGVDTRKLQLLIDAMNGADISGKLGQEDCSGHGHLHDGKCHCDAGYKLDPADPTACLTHEDPNDEEEHAGEHGHHEACSGHGHLHDGKCHCDAGYEMDPADPTACLELHDHDEDHEAHDHADERTAGESSAAAGSLGRKLLQACGGHGHPHGGECHCDSGYITDPADGLNCIPEGQEGQSEAQWVLSPADVIAAAGANGLLYMDNLTSALPLIVSCQMDPNCALATSPPVTDPSGKSGESEVELWMALVATGSFLAIPVIGMGLVFLIFNRVHRDSTTMIISIGNCLSAGLIFSLGIMHVVPATVETMFKAGISYPLNYLLIVLGFFITLALDELAHHSYEDDIHVGIQGHQCDVSPDVSKSSIPRSSMQKAVAPCTTMESMASEPITAGGSMAVITVAGSNAPDEPPKYKVFRAILPTIAFFLAIQFHACLECVIVGVQTSASNFWILFAGISIHKLFVSIAFGVKMYQDFHLSSSNKRFLLVMAILWVILPALCVIIGFLVSDGLHDVTNLVLSSLAGGTFIYIGSFEILGQEFGHNNQQLATGVWGSSIWDRFWKLTSFLVGIVLVAALSAIPHKHD